MDFKSEKKALQLPKASEKAEEQVKKDLSPQDFYAACQNKGGILERNGTICVHEIKFALLAEGKSVTSEASADLPVATIASGTAVRAMGTVNEDSVELVLNGIPIASVPTPADRLITTDGGELAFRIHPGSFNGVKVFVYGCLSQSMEEIRCPN